MRNTVNTLFQKDLNFQINSIPNGSGTDRFENLRYWGGAKYKILDSNIS